MPVQYQLTENSHLLICRSRKAALRAVDGDTTRVFDATEINLHRIGYAIYDMTWEGDQAPQFLQKEGRIGIKRNNVIDRVYFADGFWHVERYNKQQTWDVHPAIKIACKLYAKTPDYMEQMSFGQILATQRAIPKHVFMGLMGVGQPFAVVGKAVEVRHGIAAGIHIMQTSPQS